MNSPSRGLPSNSKKIKKLNSDTIVLSTNINTKKYKTFPKKIRRDILIDLWKGLLELQELELTTNTFSAEDLLELIGGTELSSYNAVLLSVLPKYANPYQGKGLTDWRRKIKSWAKNIDKSERRGAPVIPAERLNDFREEAIKILQRLPYRCFLTLRSRILEVLRTWHCTTQDPATFKENICSKHWWFDFMNKNDDIKEKWEGILLERQSTKKQKDTEAFERSPSQETKASTIHSPEVDYMDGYRQEEKNFEAEFEIDPCLIEWNDSVAEKLREEGFFKVDECQGEFDWY